MKNISPELEAACLKLAAPQPAKPKRGGKKAPAALVEAAFTAPGCWLVPVETRSESNTRDRFAKSARTIATRRAVSRTIGPHLRALAAFTEHYFSGGVLRVRLVRVGGARLDRSNVPAALKAVEDALALLMGADDGDPRWVAEWDQEPGGPAGVRIELSILGAA